MKCTCIIIERNYFHSLPFSTIAAVARPCLAAASIVVVVYVGVVGGGGAAVVVGRAVVATAAFEGCCCETNVDCCMVEGRGADAASLAGCCS